MTRFSGIVAGLLLLVSGPVLSHQSQQPLPDGLFSAEVIVSAGDQIGLSSAQIADLESLREKLQEISAELGTSIAVESERFETVVSGTDAIDESAAMAAAAAVLELQQQQHRAELEALIRSNNVLTESQRAQLTEISHAGQ